MSGGDPAFWVGIDDAGAYGRYWTERDPRTAPNPPDYRSRAGLSSGNYGQFPSIGTLIDARRVVPGFGAVIEPWHVGGWPELFIPDPFRQVQVREVIPVDPPISDPIT